jgi:uncharacterized membrane protein YhhN
LESFVAWTLAWCAALLVFEARKFRLGMWIAKPLAAAGFVAAAVSQGALDTSYGTAILAGLGLSVVGDIALIPKESQTWFRVGLVAFLLGHVAYVVAFYIHGLDNTWLSGAAIAVVVVAAIVLRWLGPHVPDGMRIPVRAYVVVISTMLATAVAAVMEDLGTIALVGALMFYVSDLAVARDRFVAPGVTNRFWGLPLYFGGQLCLAASV